MPVAINESIARPLKRNRINLPPPALYDPLLAEAFSPYPTALLRKKALEFSTVIT